MVECVKNHLAEGHSCAIISGKTGTASEQLAAYPIDIICSPALRNSYFIFNDISAIRSIIKVIDRYKPDIVISHSSKAGILTRIACSIKKIPNLFTVQGWAFEKGTPFFQYITGLTIEYLLKSLSDKYYCVSENTASLGINKIGIKKEKIVICAKLHEKRNLSVPDNTIFHNVLMVAGFRKQKDHTTAIKAINKIVNIHRRKDIRFTFIGDGSERPHIETLINKYDLKDYIFLAGETTEMDKYYESCDIVILPTHYEGLPIALIEALQKAKPIIATNVSGVSEIIVEGYNGNLIEEYDYNALSDLIVRYYEENSFANMGANALQVYKERFSYDDICIKMNTIINSLPTNSIYKKVN